MDVLGYIVGGYRKLNSGHGLLQIVRFVWYAKTACPLSRFWLCVGGLFEKFFSGKERKSRRIPASVPIKRLIFNKITRLKYA